MPLTPLAPPAPGARPPARRAAAQPSSQSPSRNVLQAPPAAQGANDSRWLASYQDWQGWARRYAREIGAVRFVSGIIADVCARTLLRIEERDEAGDWVPVDDPALDNVFDYYRSEIEDTTELIRSHAWHYQVAGECLQVVYDSPAGGVAWGIFSRSAVTFGRASDAPALVSLVPGGTVKDGTAFTVPRENVRRFWIPDEEWKGLASSPMAAAIGDLKRYQSLARLIQRTADSRLVMNGILWTPGEAHDAFAANQQLDPESGEPQTTLDEQFLRAALGAFADDDNPAAIAPFGMHWDKEWGAPEYVEVGRGLDQAGIEHRREALEDFARAVNMPASLVMSGGPGDGNHWTEWLVDEKFYGQAIAPTMNRIAHADLTATFLAPILSSLGREAEAYRVGYDPAPVIVKPDRSESAITLHEAGLLSDEATLEANSFDEADAMPEEQRQRLIEIKNAEKRAPFGVGTAPSSATSAPRTPPTMAPGAPVAAAAAVEAPVEASRVKPSLLRQLVRIDQDLGRRILAAAEVTFVEATRRAAVKVKVRAKRRGAPGRAAAAAIDAGQGIGPHLAALGVTEAELLDRAFDSFGEQTQRWMEQADEKRRRAVERAGLDASTILAARTDTSRALAAAFLSAALLAVARSRLVEGAVEAPVGEISGLVPGSLVARTLSVAAGRFAPTFGESPDVMPTLHLVADVAPVERAILGADAPVQYVWEHGFYGDPTQPFEPHEDLGLTGFTTSDPESDPALANPNPFPDADFYAPQDHDGCTCAWVPTDETPLPGPLSEMPGPGTTAVNVALGGNR